MVRYEKKGDRRGQIELRVEGNPVLLFASDYSLLLTLLTHVKIYIFKNPSFPKEQRLNVIL